MEVPVVLKCEEEYLKAENENALSFSVSKKVAKIYKQLHASWLNLYSDLDQFLADNFTSKKQLLFVLKTTMYNSLSFLYNACPRTHDKADYFSSWM